ncbi:MAG: polyphosphate polymerase domain-containing protein [Deltaproteobacteria bacterium]|nr:polyphosphate polymerase domain-containing protein [Deltaproteobacteria bacterium]MBN2673116.1 polyphosphate polymerase domain-containing protein [Deltaproteobacteria bacterium]
MIRRFNRYELKYIIPVSLRDKLIEDILKNASPDPYSGMDGYPLVSLYYDSPGLDFFWNKIEGIKFRRKLRLRIYPANPIENTTKGMVEIKQRINRTVQKKRLKMPLEDAHILCTTGMMPERYELDEMDAQVVGEVQFMVDSLKLQPACITAYHRQAFMGSPYESGLRITFDTNVSYRTHELLVHANTPNYLILPRDWTILEVKANEAIPDWVTSMLGRHNCELRRVSKYCAGIAADRHKDVMHLAMSPVPEMEGK